MSKLNTKTSLLSGLIVLALSAAGYGTHRVYVMASSIFSSGQPVQTSTIVSADAEDDDVRPMTEDHLVILQNIEDNLPKNSEQQAEYEQIQNSLTPIELCAEGNTTKSYMDGATVTDETSTQYQLLSQMHVNERGHYETDDGFIAVALGSYYGPVGTKYIITLDSGVQIKAIKADEKANEHMINGCTHYQDGSMMEFILDSETASNYYGEVNGYVAGGNLNNIDMWKGAIVSIQKVNI